MKRFLSVTLSLLIIVASFVGVLSFNTLAESTNLVSDGKFEGAAIDWTIHNNSGTSSNTFTIYDKEDGTHYAGAPAGVSMFKAVSLTANTEYTVSFDFRLISNDVPSTYNSYYRAGFMANVGNLSGSAFTGSYYNIYTKHTSTKTDWQTHTYTYTPTADFTGYFVIGSFNGDCVSGMNVDNVFVCKTSDLVTVTASANAGGSALGTVKTFSGDTVTFKAVPNTNFTFDGWYNGTTLVSNEAEYSFLATASVEYTANFVAATPASANLISDGDFDSGIGAGFEIYKNGTTADFTNEVRSGEDKYIQGESGLSIFYPVTLTGGVEYQLSFDFKFLAAADVPSTYNSFYRAGFTNSVGAIGGSAFATGSYYNIYSNQATPKNDWCTHTYKFTPSTDMTVYAVIGSYNQQGVSGFAVDNVRVYKTSDLLTVTTVAEQGGSVSESVTLLKGESATVTAQPQTDWEFTGWYNGSELVSTTAQYTFVVSESVTLTARFKDPSQINLLVNGDFESEITTAKIFDNSDASNAQGKMASEAGKWGRLYSGVTVMNGVTSASYSGDDSVEVNGNCYLQSGSTTDGNNFVRGFGQFVFLEAGDYILNFIAKSNNSEKLFYSVHSTAATVEKTADAILRKNFTVSDTWKKYSETFTVTTSQYYQIGFGGNTSLADLSFSIDNVVLTEAGNLVSVNATAETGGTVSGSGSYLKGETVTLVATPNSSYEFLGWYDGDTPKSALATYSFEVESSITLTAKFKYVAPTSGNMIVNGNFETAFTPGSIFNTSDSANPQTKMAAEIGKWGRVFSSVTPMELVDSSQYQPEDSVDFNNNTYLKSGATDDSNHYLRTFGQFVYLTGGDYVLTFIAKADTSNTFRYAVSKNATNQLSSSNEENLISGTLAATDYWCRYTATFTVTEDAYYQVGFGGNTNLSETYSFAIDNVLLVKESEYVGVSVTTEGGGSVSAPLKDIALGDLITVTAAPNTNYEFIGWYNEAGVLVSGDAEYTFTVTETVLLEGKFEYAVDKDKIIKNGAFETGDTAGWNTVKLEGGSDFDVSYDTATESNVLNSNSVGSFIYQKVKLLGGVEYLVNFNFKFASPDDVPDEYTSFYRAGFRNDYNNLNGSGFIGPYATSGTVYYSIFGKQLNKNDWYSHSFTYTPESDMECYFVIGAVSDKAVSEFSVDDISIVPSSEVSTVIKVYSASAGGSGTATATKTGALMDGTVISLNATPNSGSALEGWYDNGVLLSRDLSFKYTVDGSASIYAKFVDAELGETEVLTDNYDFSDGLTGWNLSNIEMSRNGVTVQEDDGVEYAKLTRSDMISQTIAFEPNSAYRIIITGRLPKDSETSSTSYQYIRFGVSTADSATVLQKDTITEGTFDGNYSYTQPYDHTLSTYNINQTIRKWGTYEYTFTNNTDDVIIGNVVAGITYEYVEEYHISELKVVKMVEGVSNFEPENIYGENYYNAVSNYGFEDALSDSNWGTTLPTGWNIASGHSETGNKYLQIKNSSKIYEFNASPGNTYLVAATLLATEEGTSRIEIVDEEGNTLGDSTLASDKKAILTTSADGKWNRVGYEIFVTGKKIRLKLVGGSNTLSIDDIIIVKTRNSTLEDMNVYYPNEFDYDTTNYFNPTVYYSADGTPITDEDLVDQDAENNSGDDYEDEDYTDGEDYEDYEDYTDEDIPTGDDVSGVTMMIVLAELMLVVMAVTLLPNKRKESNPKEVQ